MPPQAARAVVVAAAISTVTVIQNLFRVTRHPLPRLSSDRAFSVNFIISLSSDPRRDITQPSRNARQSSLVRTIPFYRNVNGSFNSGRSCEESLTGCRHPLPFVRESRSAGLYPVLWGSRQLLLGSPAPFCCKQRGLGGADLV